jgi:aminopeptidase N
MLPIVACKPILILTWHRPNKVMQIWLDSNMKPAKKCLMASAIKKVDVSCTCFVNTLVTRPFFESLRDFLNTNKFTAAEAHQLRLSFEKITGEDLNWFWNQWYFSKGYPILNIEYSYNTETQTAIVVVNQKTSEEQLNYFKLPVDIDFYVNGKATRKRFTITSETDTFKFSALTQPELINFDAEKMLLCKKTDNHSKAEWLYMLQHAPLYLDKFEALTKIGMAKPGTAEATTMLTKATTDPLPMV